MLPTSILTAIRQTNPYDEILSKDNDTIVTTWVSEGRSPITVYSIKYQILQNINTKYACSYNWPHCAMPQNM